MLHVRRLCSALLYEAIYSYELCPIVGWFCWPRCALPDFLPPAAAARNPSTSAAVLSVCVSCRFVLCCQACTHHVPGCYVFENWPFIPMWCPSSLLIFLLWGRLHLKWTELLLLPLVSANMVFLCSSPFKLCVSFHLKWVSWRQHAVVASRTIFVF